MKTFKRWHIYFKNLISGMFETDYYYTLKEYNTGLEKVNNSQDKELISTGCQTWK